MPSGHEARIRRKAHREGFVMGANVTAVAGFLFWLLWNLR